MKMCNGANPLRGFGYLYLVAMFCAQVWFAGGLGVSNSYLFPHMPCIYICYAHIILLLIAWEVVGTGYMA